MQKGLFHHQVLKGSRSAIESAGNWFYWSPGKKTFQTVEQQVQGFSIDDFSQNTPISVHHGWPENQGNVSLFESLCKLEDARTEFDRLIALNYKFACAIIYRSGNKSQIIGTGGRLNNAILITAKHIYRELNFNDLYVRFFHFSVESHQGKYVIFEDYIDIPILGAVDSGWGYDFGFLDVPTLADWSLRQKYIRGVGRYNSQGQPLPDGRYLLFHFAGGYPQVSVGNLAHDMPNAYSLQNIIGLQAGPGASGGMLLWCNLNAELSAAGISVYRSFLNGIPERHLICFDDLNESPLFRDNEAPYYYNPNFSIFRSVSVWDDDGYEYLRWFTGFYQKYGKDRPEKPDDSRYDVLPGHSNHHIVQCIDLFWLYKYFFDYDSNEEHLNIEFCCPPTLVKRIKAEISIKRNNLITAKMQEVSRHVHEMYQPDEHRSNFQQIMVIQRNNIEDALRAEFEMLLKDELNKRYNQTRELMARLCYPFVSSKRSFIWGIWNLFKGPATRDDNPNENLNDRCEKVKPVSFDATLWFLLTDNTQGLNTRIQNLKEATRQDDDVKLSSVEKDLRGSLQNIYSYWYKKTNSISAKMKPHDFNQNDWEKIGERDGEDRFIIKK